MSTLNTKEAAELLFCSEKQIENLARDGMIPAVKIGRSWVFPVEVLMHYINEQARKNLKTPVLKFVPKHNYPVL